MYRRRPDEADAIRMPALMKGCESSRKSFVTLLAS